MQLEQTDLLNIAAQFVNSTSSNIFLTGKAGTGKTTFLHDLALKTHKNFVIVAPTGIAALNAKGVTIHSQFLLPFGTFIPENKPAGNFSSATNFYTQYTLSRTHPLNSIRKQVLRAADLLIIDEVSMLRADILDAIDYRMRGVKRNYYKSFGGTQVLMIGDLYQLPPIVKNNEWQVLKDFYKSMHFFEAQALKKDGMVYIELDKIFRQQDDDFISVLNNLRNNVATKEDIELLNSYYRTEEEIHEEEGVVTISTHNYRADVINEKEMNALPGPSSFFEADVKGDFPEKLYPLPKRLELKVGAQVMFVKNDSSMEKEYYNGKLARVDYIDEEGVTVVMADTRKQFVLRKEEWVNKKYTINAQSKELDEEEIGSFEQYPVKLAWAVTVHKSQGLTFDKAIIDVGEAFAPGQVYVALSRLRSLAGLILRTKINTNAINTDRDVVIFSNEKQAQTQLPETLQKEKINYLNEILSSTFNFALIENQLEYLQKKQSDSLQFEDEEMQHAIEKIQSKLAAERSNTTNYRNQLSALLKQNDLETLLSRIEKGASYYGALLKSILNDVLIHCSEVEQFSRTKTYLNVLSEVDQLIMQALNNIDKASHITKCIVEDSEISRTGSLIEKRVQERLQMLEKARNQAEKSPKNKSGKSGRKRKTGKKKVKGETYQKTYALLKEGKDAEEIAKIRELTVNTIQGHIAKGIGAGEFSVAKFLTFDAISEITNAFNSNKEGNIGGVYALLDGKYNYGELRMVQNHLISKKELQLE